MMRLGSGDVRDRGAWRRKEGPGAKVEECRPWHRALCRAQNVSCSPFIAPQRPHKLVECRVELSSARKEGK